MAAKSFVSNSLSDSISEIDTSKNDVGGAYLIGDGPVRGLVSSDNALLYVANFRSQYVTVYSIDDGKRLSPSIHVGDGPQALAFSTRGLLLVRGRQPLRRRDSRSDRYCPHRPPCGVHRVAHRPRSQRNRRKAKLP